jgi:3-methyl-2-oxobutanoate hydroxymethyltransferase
MMKIQDWSAAKLKNQKLALTTCYDAWSARILAESPIDAILVGDSAAMVMHGESSTLPIDVHTMSLHVAAVARGVNGKKFVIGDMPFLSNRKGVQVAMDCVQSLMKAGAHAVKLEGLRGHEDVVKNIVGSGVPVMGHLGLTPQSVHGLGGYKVQGRESEIATQLLEDAKALQDLGAFSVVLECVPYSLAQRITQSLSIPTIGIGAGPHCDGQILVLHDLLGLSGQSFKFVRPFANGEVVVKNALAEYSAAVKSKDFPSMNESFE